MENSLNPHEDELEYLSSSTLTRRKDFIDREAEARNAPNRVLYFRPNADCDRLIKACTEKLAANSTNLRALLIRASSYVKKGALREALQDYTSVMEVEAGHVEATFHRGTVYEKLGRLDEAIADFTRVLKLEPDHVKASYARGACRNLKGEFAPAIEDYAMALEKDRVSSAHTRRRSQLRGSVDRDLDALGRHGSALLGEGSASGRQSSVGAYPHVTGMGAATLVSRPGTPELSFASGPAEGQWQQHEGGRAAALRPHSPLLEQPVAAQHSQGGQPAAAALVSHPLQPEGAGRDWQQPQPASGQAGTQRRRAGCSLAGSMASLGLTGAAQQQGRDHPQRQREAAAAALRGQRDGWHDTPVTAPQSSARDEARALHGQQGPRQEAAGQDAAGQAPVTSRFVLPIRQLQAKAAAYEQPMSGRSSYVWDAGDLQGAAEQTGRLSRLSPSGARSAMSGDLDSPITSLTSRLEGDNALPMEAVSPSRQGSALADGSQQPRRSSASAPRSADQHHARGYALRKQGNFVAAVQEYTRAIAVDGCHFKALFNRGFSLDKLGEYDKAVADYTRAVEVNPRNSYAHYNRGITRDRMGNYAGAVADFTAAIELDGGNADFYHNRGFSLRKQGLFEAAIADYSMAIQLNPGHCRAYYNRAFSHDRLQQYEAAIADYGRALEIEPGNATAFHNRGSLYERMGRLREALADFGQAIAIDGRSALSFNARGLLLERMGQSEAALADFNQAIALEGGNVAFLRNRGLCNRARGSYHKAVEDFDRVLTLSPSDVASLSNRGYAFRKLGVFRKAAADYTAALQLSPGTVRLYNNRGYCLAKLGKYKAAVADYNRVLELDAANCHAYHNRGISFDKLGQFEKAIADFTRVLELDPVNVNAYFNRGSAYDSVNDYERAVADYTRALDLDSSIAGPSQDDT